MNRPADSDCLILHSSCVVFLGRAVLIVGASGRGKSALALHLMALGAQLVADDRSCLWRNHDDIWADAPAAIRGQIEARHVGILNATAAGPAKIGAVIDLDLDETERLPAKKSRDLLGLSVPLMHNVQAQHFPAAILQFLKAGRWA